MTDIMSRTWYDPDTGRILGTSRAPLADLIANAPQGSMFIDGEWHPLLYTIQSGIPVPVRQVTTLEVEQEKALSALRMLVDRSLENISTSAAQAAVYEMKYSEAVSVASGSGEVTEILHAEAELRGMTVLELSKAVMSAHEDASKRIARVEVYRVATQTQIRDAGAIQDVERLIHEISKMEIVE